MRLGSAVLRCWLGRFVGAGIEGAYRDVWRHLARWAQMSLCARQGRRARALSGPGTRPVEGVLDHHLFGFHPPELSRGRSCRWTAPLAALRLALPPGAHDVVLETNGARQGPLSLRGYLDGVPLPPEHVRIDGNAVVFHVEVGPAAKQGHWLVFTCDPVGPRNLGLPVVALGVRGACAEPALRAA